VGAMPLLVPGVGAQGGDLAEALGAGLDADRQGLIINASRSVLYAGARGDGSEFAAASRRAALALHEAINAIRNPSP